MELFASLAPWPWGAVLSLLRLIAYTALVFELASHRETAASPLPTLPSWSLSIAKSTQEFQRLDVKQTCQRHCV